MTPASVLERCVAFRVAHTAKTEAGVNGTPITSSASAADSEAQVMHASRQFA